MENSIELTIDVEKCREIIRKDGIQVLRDFVLDAVNEIETAENKIEVHALIYK